MDINSVVHALPAAATSFDQGLDHHDLASQLLPLLEDAEPLRDIGKWQPVCDDRLDVIEAVDEQVQDPQPDLAGVAVGRPDE